MLVQCAFSPGLVPGTGTPAISKPRLTPSSATRGAAITAADTHAMSERPVGSRYRYGLSRAYAYGFQSRGGSRPDGNRSPCGSTTVPGSQLVQRPSHGA